MTTEEFNDYLKDHKIYFAYQVRFRIKAVTSFDINDGWYQLLHDCFEEMFAAGWDGELAQVKEKWGQLQVYLTHYYPELEEIIKKYNNLSYTVCERCGSTESVTCTTLSGWYLTLCPLCRDALEQVRQQNQNAKNNNTIELSGESSETTEIDSTQ